MKTYEQMEREESPGFRYLVLMALAGSAGLIAAATGMSRTGATVVVAILFLTGNTFIWLRQNPTLKQIEKRKRKASPDGSAETAPNHTD